MSLIQLWEQHPRTRRNVVVMVVLDTALLLASIFSVPYLIDWWSAFARTVPNLYHSMFSQLLAVIFGLPPTTGAGGAPLYYATQFLSLLTFHLCIAFFVGWLLRNRENSMGWRITNYVLLFVLLLGFHLIGTFLTIFAH